MFKKLFGRAQVGRDKKPRNLLSPQEFAEYFVRWLIDNAHWPGKGNQPSPARIIKLFEVELGEGNNKCSANLYNAYSEYKMSQESLDEIVERYAKGFLDAFLLDKFSDEKTPSRLVPLIRPREWLDDNEKFREFAYEHLIGNLYIVYGFSLNKTIAIAFESELAAKGLAKKEWKQTSLVGLNNELENLAIEGSKPLFFLTAGGNFESSLILEPRIWTKKNFPVEGDFVFSIPSRDLLLVTGTKEKGGLDKIRELTLKMYNSGDHVISQDLFMWRKGKIKVFVS